MNIKSIIQNKNEAFVWSFSFLLSFYSNIQLYFASEHAIILYI
jgi:hypothetical protein